MDKLKKAFDITATIKLLRTMEKKGLLTKEDLDKPSEGYLITTGQRWNHITKEIEWNDYRTPQGSKSAIPKHQIPQHRNLLRDTRPIEAVEASADPRDFDPGSQSQIHPESTQVLGSENEAIYPQVSDDNNQEIGLFEPVPF